MVNSPYIRETKFHASTSYMCERTNLKPEKENVVMMKQRLSMWYQYIYILGVQNQSGSSPKKISFEKI